MNQFAMINGISTSSITSNATKIGVNMVSFLYSLIDFINFFIMFFFLSRISLKNNYYFWLVTLLCVIFFSIYLKDKCFILVYFYVFFLSYKKILLVLLSKFLLLILHLAFQIFFAYLHKFFYYFPLKLFFYFLHLLLM